MKKQRNHYRPEEKVAILRQHFLDKPLKWIRSGLPTTRAQSKELISEETVASLEGPSVRAGILRFPP